MVSIGQKMVASAGWAVAGDVLAALCGALSLAISARFVPKAEFGLVGVVTLVLVLLETLTASGIDQALIQRDKEVEGLLDSAWTWQLGRGVVIGAAVMLAAPWLARFYDLPQLSSIAALLALQPILRGASNMALVLRIRALDFRASFVLAFAPALLRLVCVAPLSMAWRNAWALVAAVLVEHATRLVLSYVLQPRTPRLRFAWSELRPLLRFGRWITGLSILMYFTTRGDDLFVSKYFGPAELASYQLAYGLANTPVTSITHVLGRVAFPAYARLYEQASGLREAFAEMLKLTAVAAFITAVALYCGLPFLPLVVGAQWQDAIGIGRVLAIAGAVRAMIATGGPLFLGTGRPDLDVKMNTPRLLLLALLILPLARAFGLFGVSLASLASVCACVPIWAFGARAQAGMRARDFGAALGASLFAAGVAASVFGTLSVLLPRDVPGLALFTGAGLALCYAALGVCEKLSGVSLLPSLQRLKRL